MSDTVSCKAAPRPAVSVVVPVYNAERYLRRCLDGLRAQTMAPDMELIFVDDGSTDGSLAILRSLEAEDPSVRVIRQPNAGVSAARNAGARAARGAYVGFVDADDRIEPTMFEVLYRAATRLGADVSVVGFNIQFGTRWASRYGTGEEVTFDQESALADFFREHRIDGSVCNKLFARQICSRIAFDSRLSIGEDRRYVFDALMLSRRVVHTDECLYWYYANPGSAMHSCFSADRLLALDSVQEMREIACEPYPGLAEVSACYELRVHAKTYEELLADEHAAGELAEERERLRSYLRSFDYSIARRHMLPRHFWAALLLDRCPRLYMCAARLLKYRVRAASSGTGASR